MTITRKEFLLQIIKEIGEFQLKHFQTDIVYDEKKSVTDVVSFVDTESQDMFEEKIKALFPEDDILGEETYDDSKEYNTKSLWVIDPLDGTLMFQRGFKDWGPMIAYIEDEKIIFSALYMPVYDELYFADKTGSYCNGSNISVSSIDSVSASLLEVKPVDMAKLVEKAGRLQYHDGAISHFTLVASGNADAYVNLTKKTNPWDLLPGMFLVQQAGGKVTDKNGAELGLFESHYIASNGKIHEELLQIYRES